MVLNIIILRIYYPFQTIVLALPTTSANLAMDWGPTSKPYWSTNCHCIHLCFKPSNEKISILFKFFSRKRQIILLRRQKRKFFILISPCLTMDPSGIPSSTVADPTVASSANLSPVTKSDGRVIVTLFLAALSIRFLMIFDPSSS